MEWSRRELFGIVGLSAASLVTGCIGRDWQRVTDLSVYNTARSSLSVSIRLVRLPDEKVLVDDVKRLESNSSVEYKNPITTGRKYEIGIDVREGPSDTYVWDSPEKDSDEYGVNVTVSEKSIDFQPLVA